MVTRQGNMFLYDNFGAGCAADPDEENGDFVFLTFTDKDNEEVHMFRLHKSKIEQYFNLVKQTAGGVAVETFSAADMPKGGQRG